MTDCLHTWTEFRPNERGSWCKDCGEKVYDVDPRPCGLCKHFRRLIGGSSCVKHLMHVNEGMNVTFKTKEGTCFEPMQK